MYRPAGAATCEDEEFAWDLLRKKHQTGEKSELCLMTVIRMGFVVQESLTEEYQTISLP